MDGKTLVMKFNSNNYSEKIIIYGLLSIWAFICLFPIFWTITTSFKNSPISECQTYIVKNFTSSGPAARQWLYLNCSVSAHVTTPTTLGVQGVFLCNAPPGHTDPKYPRCLMCKTPPGHTQPRCPSLPSLKRSKVCAATQ